MQPFTPAVAASNALHGDPATLRGGWSEPGMFVGINRESHVRECRLALSLSLSLSLQCWPCLLGTRHRQGEWKRREDGDGGGTEGDKGRLAGYLPNLTRMAGVDRSKKCDPLRSRFGCQDLDPESWKVLEIGISTEA